MSTEFYNTQWQMPNEANKSKQSNYSMDFDGSSQYVSISNSTALSSYSISCWVNADTLSNFTRLVSLDSSNHRFLGLHGDGTLISGYKSGSWNELFTTSTITTGTWNHIVLVDNGTNTKIYVNTVENTLSNSINVDGPNYYIGSYNGSGNFFNGQIDGVAIFDYALSSSQVTTLYGTGSAMGDPMSLSPAPKAYYKLSDSVWDGSEYITANNAVQDYVFGNLATNSRILTRISVSDLTNCTQAIWFKTSTNAQSNKYIFFCGPYNTFSISLQGTDTVRGDIIVNPATSGASQSVTFSYADGKWHHYILNFDGSNLSMYIDGVLVARQARSGTLRNGTVFTAIGNVSGTSSSAGAIGEFSNFIAYEHTLTDGGVSVGDAAGGEIATLYNNGSPTKTLADIPQNSNLKAWYKLNASEIYNSSSTEWNVDNSANPSNYSGSVYFNGTFTGGWTSQVLLPSNFTFSFWIKTTYTGSTYTSFLESAFSIPANEGYDVFRYNNMASGRWRLNTNVSGLTNVPVTPVINDGKWHNIIVNYNPTTTTMTVYTDNQQSYSSSSWDIGDNQQNITRLGKAFDGNGAAFTDTNLSNLAVWTGDLTTSQRTELFNNGTPSVLTTHSNYSNLNHWWTMQDKTGGFQDVVGSSINVSLPSAVIETGFVNALASNSAGMNQSNLVQSDLQTVAPYSKYAMNFDGNDYIDCGNDSSLKITSNFSVSAWVKSSDQLSFGVAVGNNSVFSLQMSDSLNQFRFNVFSGGWVAATYALNPIDDGKWHHVVGTHDGSTIKIYVDNVKGTDASAGAVGSNTQPFLIGYLPGNAGLYFNGQISNVSYWSTALTQTQVAELYNEGIPSNLNSHSAYSNLVSWWQLGEGVSYDGTYLIAQDYKGNNHGTSNSSMDQTDIVNGVGTYLNGASSGFSAPSATVTNIVNNAPYSDKNAISLNMQSAKSDSGISSSTPQAT